MKSLHIRDVDEATVSALKRRAARHHRSLQMELRHILVDAAAVAPADGNVAPGFDLRTVRTGQRRGTWSRESIYDDDGR